MTAQDFIGDGRREFAAMLSQAGGWEYARRFFRDLILYGVIALIFRSWFPLALGALLFFTDDEFIEWTLEKVGIRFVPDTFGPEFIKCFAFLSGCGVLIGYWKDAAPAWLSSWLLSVTSWPAVGGAALLAGAVAITSIALLDKLVQFGFPIAPDGAIWKTIKVLVALATIALFLGAATVADGFATP